MDLVGLAAVLALPLGLLPLIYRIGSDRSTWRQLERLSTVGDKMRPDDPGFAVLQQVRRKMIEDLAVRYAAPDWVKTVLRLRWSLPLVIAVIVIGVDVRWIYPNVPPEIARLESAVVGSAIGVGLVELGQLAIIGIRRRERKISPQSPAGGS